MARIRWDDNRRALVTRKWLDGQTHREIGVYLGKSAAQVQREIHALICNYTPFDDSRRGRQSTKEIRALSRSALQNWAQSLDQTTGER
jgi:hypothetical protein